MGKRKRTAETGNKFENRSSSGFEDRTGPQMESACDLVLCEDPTTGEIVIRPKGKCPRGYVEKVIDKLERQDEIKVYVPKKITIVEE
jgi:hypothetical protein